MRNAPPDAPGAERVMELDVEEDTGIEVEEQQFDSWEALLAHVKQVMGELE
jgi:hypothetical protein